ncbi:LiaF transmembrane domain-containing protein [Candidatus Leptofilum sp.]|uniref:LiaF transmembrane domain-containing protein n=1 Tax=Candidatus Leptofilum sp. TaxID=3241576 RepID=UPI003B5A8C6D
MSKESVLKIEETRKLQRRQSWPAYGVIAIGLGLLASQIFGFDMIDVLWPGFVLAPGLLLLWPAYNSTPEHPSRLSFLAVPGALFITTAILLFVMNLSNYFEAWAYSWPLVFASVAWGLMYMRRFDPDHNIHRSGFRFMRFMVLLAMGLVVFFEVVVFGSINPLLPLGVIGFGIYLLVKERRASKQ